jgi:hypothetical protein
VIAARDSPRETLANLSITGHLRCFSDQPVAEIVQCGEPFFQGACSDPECEQFRLLGIRWQPDDLFTISI